MATIRVHTIPNAKIDKVARWRGDVIKIKLRAPAVERKAKTALRCFLTDELRILKHAIVLEHGHTSRDKVIRIIGLTEEAIRSSLIRRT